MYAAAKDFYVENTDYLFDLLCARSAGAIPVLLKNHHKADEFAKHADFVIENIAGLLKIIEGR